MRSTANNWWVSRSRWVSTAMSWLAHKAGASMMLRTWVLIVGFSM